MREVLHITAKEAECLRDAYEAAKALAESIESAGFGENMHAVGSGLLWKLETALRVLAPEPFSAPVSR